MPTLLERRLSTPDADINEFDAQAMVMAAILALSDNNGTKPVRWEVLRSFMFAIPIDDPLMSVTSDPWQDIEPVLQDALTDLVEVDWASIDVSGIRSQVDDKHLATWNGRFRKRRERATHLLEAMGAGWQQAEV